MRCGSARALIRDACDTPLQANQARELEMHTATCTACATYAQDFATLSEWTAALPVEEPPAHFEWRLKLRLAQAERERAALDQPVSAPRRRLRPAFEFGGAFLAAAAVVVALGLTTWRSSTSESPTSVLPPAPSDKTGRITQLADKPQPPTARETILSVDSLVADTLLSAPLR